MLIENFFLVKIFYNTALQYNKYKKINIFTSFSFSF